MKRVSIELSKNPTILDILVILKQGYIIRTLLLSFLIGFTPLPIISIWWVCGDLRVQSYGLLLFILTPLISYSSSFYYIHSRMKSVELL